ncbi:MAG: bacterial transcriptional activator domain-containing protein [Anaerolineae bacterium]
MRPRPRRRWPPTAASSLEGVGVPDAPEYDDWLFVERDRCLNLYLQSAWLGREHAAGGRFEQAAGYAHRVLAVDPLREEVHRALMLFLARTGQRSTAIAQYQSCAALLRRELGIEPLGATTNSSSASRPTSR